MKYTTNDLLYGMMQYLATYDPKEKQLYLTIDAVCKPYVSAVTLKRH